MPEIRVHIELSNDEILKYYKGYGTNVSAVAENGQTILFPARVLRQFMTRAGVSGMFVINYDDNGKFQHMKKET